MREGRWVRLPAVEGLEGALKLVWLMRGKFADSGECDGIDGTRGKCDWPVGEGSAGCAEVRDSGIEPGMFWAGIAVVGPCIGVGE